MIIVSYRVKQSKSVTQFIIFSNYMIGVLVNIIIILSIFVGLLIIYFSLAILCEEYLVPGPKIIYLPNFQFKQFKNLISVAVEVLVSNLSQLFSFLLTKAIL